jgi:hypothetical protein
MRQRRYVLYRGDAQSDLLKGRDGRFAPGTRTLDPNFNLTHAITHSGSGTTLCSLLCGKGRAFARTFETHTASGTRANRVTVWVRNRNQRIVKRRFYVHDGLRDAPSDFSPCTFCHYKKTLINKIIILCRQS